MSALDVIYAIGAVVFGLIGATVTIVYLKRDDFPTIGCVGVGACAAGFFGLGWPVFAPAALLALVALRLARKVETWLK